MVFSESGLWAWISRHLWRNKYPEIQPSLMDRLSHELRTSLTGIVGYAEYMETGSSDSMMNFTAHIIRESGKSLTRTSQSFFDFYLLSQRQIRLKCSRFVFSDVIREAVVRHQLLASEREVSLGFTCADDALEVVVSSDQARLLQVMEALVFGVLQASDQWSMVHVHLALDQVQKNLLLSFVSSGVSVSPPQIQGQPSFGTRTITNSNYKKDPGLNWRWQRR